MLSSRIRTFLKFAGAGILGAVVGILLTHWLVSRVTSTWAWVALAVANQHARTGDDDMAIVLLSQATAKDPDFYAPYEALGDIFSKKGNHVLALSMYKKALTVFDRESSLPAGRINQDERNSIRAKIAALQKQMKNQHPSTSGKEAVP
jgi:tetratricopeptide (TPR) repeat protein